MAFVIANLIGFETDGLDEASGSNGTPDVQNTTVLTGNFSLECPGSGDDYFCPHKFESDGVAVSAGHDASTIPLQLGFAFQVADATPAALSLIFICQVGVFTQWELSLNTDGILRARVNGTDFDGTTVLQDGVRHYIEILFTLNDTTGRFLLKLDGNIEIDETGLDSLNQSSSTLDSQSLKFRGNAQASSFFDDFYTATDPATDGSDMFNDFEVFMYQSAHSTNQDVGDALTTGTWDDAGQTPLNESAGNEVAIEDVAARTCTTDFDDGPRTGPSGDSRIDGDSNINGAKYFFRLHRTTGQSKTFNAHIGNSGDGATATANLTLGVAYALRSFVSESATIAPLSTEFFRAGIQRSATNGQDLFCGEMWANIGHVPDVAVVEQPFSEPPMIHRQVVVRAY